MAFSRGHSTIVPEHRASESMKGRCPPSWVPWKGGQALSRIRGRDQKSEERLFAGLDGWGDSVLFGVEFLRSVVIVYSWLK